MRDKIYYITDTYGTFYGFDSTNKMIPVKGKEQATKFTFLKANNVLQNMVKAINRNQFILLEAEEEDTEEEVIHSIEVSDWRDTDFDGLDTDWKSDLENILNFVSQLHQYKCNLKYMLSQVDKEICDILHYIEFMNLDAANGYKVYKMLRERRLRRRQIKDEDVCVTAAIQALGNLSLQGKLRESISQITKLEDREYHPRILTELFGDAS